MVPSRGISAQKRPICAAVDMVPIEIKGFIDNLVMDICIPQLRKRPDGRAEAAREVLVTIQRV